MNITSRKFQHLLEANRILSSTLHLSELLRQVMRLATDVVEAETSSLLLYDEASGQLVFDIALTDKESELKQIRLDLGEGIAGWTAREKKTQIINNVEGDPRWARRADDKTNFKTRSVLAVPLLYRGRLLGVVETINKKNGGFTQEDADVLEAFAAQASVSLENARMFGTLQEEKEKIEAIFSQMSDGAVFVDASGKKLLANASAEKLLGPERVGRPAFAEIFEGFDCVPPIPEMLSSREKYVPAELIRSAGKTMYLSGIASRVSDTAGGVLGSLFIFRDVTADKKESIVKRNFLALISHKLKTPLVSILGYVPLLLREPSLTEFQKKALDSMHRQGNHLANLVDKLLYFTVIEGDFAITKQKQPYSALLSRVLETLKPYCEERSAEVTVEKDIEELPQVEMDGEKMEAVVRNIIENAIKFNTRERKTVSIAACRMPDGCRGLSIRDNGPGIPPEEREKIFQKFYQIEESFTGQVEGAGLGLALVKRIVEAHGGRVWLESAIGTGSTFHVVLPA